MRMSIARFDPFREFAQVQDRINRALGDTFRLEGQDGVLDRGDWLPPVDIFENEQHEVVLSAELPGVRKEDLDLKVENNTLTIRGERKREQESSKDSYHRVERVYGSFSRSFSLPTTIDTNQVKAEFRDGVLTVTLPAREEAKPRQIQVQVN